MGERSHNVAPGHPSPSFVVSCQRQGGRDRSGTPGKLAATGPPSPGWQVRLAFARGPVATAITRKMASKFTPLLWHPDCSTRLRKQQANRLRAEKRRLIHDRDL
jgi:hypothetical protein